MGYFKERICNLKNTNLFINQIYYKRAIIEPKVYKHFLFLFLSLKA